METEFTPIASLIGGGLIGASAVLLMASVGRIAGISGIVSQLLSPSDKDASILKDSAFFVIGLLIAAPLYVLVTGGAPAQAMSSNAGLLVAAGLLVGFGSVLGNGCTSGHGVCGISRGSVRSITATVTFMATAVITVYVLRHVVGA